MRTFRLAACLAALCAAAQPARAEVDEVRIPKGAGGVGFVTLLTMEKHALVEKHAKAAGLPDLKVQWINVGGPAQVNDALLSGAAHVVPGGPPGFLLLRDRTLATLKVIGLSAMTSMPMYLNTRSPDLKSLKDVTGKDKIAVTAVKASIPAIIMQMYARKELGPEQTFHFDPMTVTMTHPDGVTAMLSGVGEINLHYTSPPFHQRERRDPKIRTLQTTTDVMGGSTTFTMLYMTGAFRDANPKVTAAVLAALDEANAMINADKTAAANVYLDSVGRKGWTLEEILEVLNDPQVKYTTNPENTLKYAHFMHAIGSIKVKPDTWQELFVPEMHAKSGS